MVGGGWVQRRRRGHRPGVAVLAAIGLSSIAAAFVGPAGATTVAEKGQIPLSCSPDPAPAGALVTIAGGRDDGRGFRPGADVIVRFGDEVVAEDQVRADARFRTTAVLDLDPGTYDVTAWSEGAEARTSCTVAAPPDPPTISLSRTTVRAGQTITVSLSGFGPGAAVAVTIDGDVVAEGVADDDGSLELDAAVPDDLLPGRVEVGATIDGEPVAAASAGVTVADAGTDPGTGDDPDDYEPDDGSDGGPVPGAGSLTARWPGVLEPDTTGVVNVELRVLRTLPDEARGWEDPGPSDRPQRRRNWVVPVYVVPGDVELTFEALPGLEIDRVRPAGAVTDDGLHTVTLEAQGGRISEVSLVVRSIEPGETGLVVTGRQVTRADPDRPLSEAELSELSLDRMQLTLELEIESPPPSDDPPPSPPGDGSGRTGESGGSGGGVDLDGINTIVGLLTTLVAVSLFLLWLIGDSPWVNRRLPWLAAVARWLHGRVDAYRNRASSKDPSSDAEAAGDEDVTGPVDDDAARPDRS